ncbi:MAG: hypothetical protein A3C84_04815 [Candidatus Ryanbacteria bacterium RIFCSPHIGHO2_02_FULL_48_12]|nr:MAG: hypothetical protein A3C84_04815 [Candidatus Ryanbacteria bacterium RIFCSPHIGHO2_02_FULL_48_12]
MTVKIKWKGYDNVRHIYPRTHMIRYLLSSWGIPSYTYDGLTLLIEFCRPIANQTECYGLYRGERDGVHHIQINSDLILHLNQWQELGPTGTHELRHFAWHLTIPRDRYRLDKDGFLMHYPTAEEEIDCVRAEKNFRWIVGIDFETLPRESFRPRQKPRFRQLLLLAA